jgi:hypothetical protein
LSLADNDLSLATIGRSLMCNSIAVFIASILLLIPSGTKATRRRARWLKEKFIA